MITVWCITDDLHGHKTQLEGLVQALALQAEVQCQWFSINHREQWVTAPTPTLIFTVGTRTQFTAWKLHRRYGGKLVTLSNPYLPRFLFDLCVIPRHDGVSESRRVVTTVGAINRVTYSEQSDPQRGLILIGGPSQHYGWSDDDIIQQLTRLITTQAAISWTLTTSRRTPPSFIPALELAMTHQLADSGLVIVPLEQTDANWLRAHYRDCGVIWVTEDSVSMVYESLSSGAETGILNVPGLGKSRVSRGLSQLIEEGRVMSLGDKAQSTKLATQVHAPLREAERAAQAIIERLL